MIPILLLYSFISLYFPPVPPIFPRSSFFTGNLRGNLTLRLCGKFLGLPKPMRGIPSAISKFPIFCPPPPPPTGPPRVRT